MAAEAEASREARTKGNIFPSQFCDYGGSSGH